MPFESFRACLIGDALARSGKGSAENSSDPVAPLSTVDDVEAVETAAAATAAAAMAANTRAMAAIIAVSWRHRRMLFYHAVFSFSRLPSWQEDLTVAIRGRLCRLCVRALFKMALSIAAQWYRSGRRKDIPNSRPGSNYAAVLITTRTRQKAAATDVLSGAGMWRSSANRWVPSFFPRPRDLGHFIPRDLDQKGSLAALPELETPRWRSCWRRESEKDGGAIPKRWEKERGERGRKRKGESEMERKRGRVVKDTMLTV